MIFFFWNKLILELILGGFGLYVVVGDFVVVGIGDVNLVEGGFVDLE